jgi:hypothetical protein
MFRTPARAALLGWPAAEEGRGDASFRFSQACGGKDARERRAESNHRITLFQINDLTPDPLEQCPHSCP